MNVSKIGNFIAECRKEQGYTQAALADKLHVTNRAVSKWECGHSLPDASIMLDLCKLLGITVTELLEGEKGMEKNEELLLEMVREKQAADKRLLRMEVVTGIICVLILIVAVEVASFVQLPEIWRVLIIVAGLIPLLVAMPFMIQIEQTAGYYECQHCKHRYVPTFKAVFMAMHTGRTRYMKCPECGKKSWQKKVLSKDKTE